MLPQLPAAMTESHEQKLEKVAELKAALLLQAGFRGFSSRQRSQWKLKYLQVRRQMAFQQNARDNANVMRYEETMSTLRTLVPHAVYSGLKVILGKINKVLADSEDEKHIDARMHALCLESPWAKVLLPSATHETITEECTGVMLFLDLSGFVSLTENIRKSTSEVNSKHGGAGKRRQSSKHAANPAEHLVTVVNEHFVEAIAVVHEFHGDILKFAGDALQIMFRVENTPGLTKRSKSERRSVTTTESTEMKEMVIRAMLCSLLIIQRLKQKQITGLKRALNLKIGLSYGLIKSHVIGGEYSRYEFFVSGLPVEESAKLSSFATNGNEVIVSERVMRVCDIPIDTTGVTVCAAPDKDSERYMLLGETFINSYTRRLQQHLSKILRLSRDTLKGTELFNTIRMQGGRGRGSISMPSGIGEEKSKNLTNVKANQLEFEELASAADGIFTGDYSALQTRQARNNVGGKLKYKCITLSSALSSFLPIAILPQVIRGHINFISGIRDLSVMFLKFTNARDLLDDSVKMQQAFVTFQGILYAHGGSVRQVMVDDKGFVFIAFFGMLGHKHSQHAMRVAVYLTKQYTEQGVHAAIGVAAGDCYVGLIGAASRSEFTMVGTSVNIAARLMSKAEKLMDTKSDNYVSTPVSDDGDAERVTGPKKKAKYLVSMLCDKTVRERVGESSAICNFTKMSLKLKGLSAPITVYRPIVISRVNIHIGMVRLAASTITMHIQHQKSAALLLERSMSDKGSELVVKRHSTKHSASFKGRSSVELDAMTDIPSSKESPTEGGSAIAANHTGGGEEKEGEKRNRGAASARPVSAANTAADHTPLYTSVLFGDPSFSRSCEDQRTVLRLLAIVGRFSKYVSFNCLYACTTDKALRYRFSEHLESACKAGLLCKTEYGTIHEWNVLGDFSDSYSIEQTDTLKPLHDHLLSSAKQELHLSAAKFMEEQLKASGGSDVSVGQLPIFGHTGLAPEQYANVLLIIAQHFDASGAEYRHKAAKYFSAAASGQLSAGLYSEARENAAIAAVLFEEDFAEAEVKSMLCKALAEDVMLHAVYETFDWDSFKEEGPDTENLSEAMELYDLACSVLANTGVRVFADLGSTVTEEDECVLLSTFEGETGVDVQSTYTLQSPGCLRHVDSRHTVHPSVFFHMQTPINHEWSTIPCSTTLGNFERTLKIRFQEAVLARVCEFALDTIARLCEHGFQLYTQGATAHSEEEEMANKASAYNVLLKPVELDAHKRRLTAHGTTITRPQRGSIDYRGVNFSGMLNPIVTPGSPGGGTVAAAGHSNLNDAVPLPPTAASAGTTGETKQKYAVDESKHEEKSGEGGEVIEVVDTDIATGNDAGVGTGAKAKTKTRTVISSACIVS